jgi:Tfp pilus assembly protein PilN
VRAVNLIPGEARRQGVNVGGRSGGLPYVILGALAAAVLLVTVYVLTNNTISDRQAKVTGLQAQAAQAQTEAAQLKPYRDFAQLAALRAETVRQIASTRFDWHSALGDLSRVVQANSSLQSLVGSVAHGAGVGGTAGGVALRGDIAAPAFELTGCTSTQDDVARLMSRLRLMNGVTRVSLSDSQKTDGAQTGAGVSSSGGSVRSGCPANTPAFHITIFFQPLPGAGPNGATNLSAQPVSATPTATGGSK